MMSLAKKVTYRSKHDALALMESAREIYEDPALRDWAALRVMPGILSSWIADEL